MANWFSMTILGMIVTGRIPNERLPPGEPLRLINGMDYLGGICGLDAKTRRSNDTMSGKYFAGMAGYATYSTVEFRKYDVSGYPNKMSKAYFLLTGEAVCIDECPTDDDYDRFICKYAVREELQAFQDAGDYEGYYYRGMQAVKDYQCSQTFATTDYIGYCVFDTRPPPYSAALMGAAPRAWPNPTPVPSPAPSYAPTAPRPIPAPTPQPTYVWNNTVPCTEDLSTCDEQLGYCETIFCPDCMLPGFCDFSCGFCSPPPTVAPTTEDFRLANQAASDDDDLVAQIVGDLY